MQFLGEENLKFSKSFLKLRDWIFHSLHFKYALDCSEAACFMSLSSDFNHQKGFVYFFNGFVEIYIEYLSHMAYHIHTYTYMQ